MTADTEHALNRRHVRRAFDAAADCYDDAAVLQRHVADELMQRLDEQDLSPRRVLDIGCGTGRLDTALTSRFPHATVLALDLAPAMARRAARVLPGRVVCADAEKPPLAAGSFDLILSNMTLQWCDHAALFAAVGELLAPGGVWLFSTVGPDTLIELRGAWRTIDAAERVHDFVDMHHLGDALLALGFVDPVLDVDRINLTYPDVSLLMRDLRTLGVVNARRDRARGLLGRGVLRRLADAYERYRDESGELPSTWEVVYGQARAPAPASVRVSFDAGGTHER